MRAFTPIAAAAMPNGMITPPRRFVEPAANSIGATPPITSRPHAIQKAHIVRGWRSSIGSTPAFSDTAPRVDPHKEGLTCDYLVTYSLGRDGPGLQGSCRSHSKGAPG